ncbi:MAG: glycine--tRNA ligase subunit beta [Casimicrobiaceae bacterium]|nr:glycine--tRNA ligase subunit beta [Casimicrobiaceae bacterium]
MQDHATAPLLVELFTEELPPKALKRLSESLAETFTSVLSAAGLVHPASTTDCFATPRRLACRVNAVFTEAPPRPIREKLMPLAVARSPEGLASAALRKKLAALGREPLAEAAFGTVLGGEKLVVESDGKAEYVFLIGQAPGKTLAEVAPAALTQALEKLPIPKLMHYELADGLTEVQFVRPAHALVLMHGEQVIRARALGLDSGNLTHGHRFQGAHNIEIDHASRYEELLRSYGRVEPDFARRRALILEQLKARASELGANLGAEEDYDSLLDEVTALVEWPSVYVCRFDAAFLEVPSECLILTMKTHQRYFPLFDAQGALINRFLVVSNMALEDPSRVIEGNERVVRPRLADARFFFETDRKMRLEARVAALAKVVYHNKLGTQAERVERLRAIAGYLAPKVGADPALTDRAAELAKADLVTLMVGEFPELQGTMGRHYALHDGEAPEVATACAEHYMPRFAGDRLPSPGVATAVALADKIEALVGLFGIGQIPTGDRDPYALRRHALGVLRILIEQALRIDLPALVAFAAQQFGQRLARAEASNAALLDFMFERLAGYLREKGYASREIDAVLAVRPPLDEVVPRLAAVRAFAALPEAESLAAANKRVANILRKAQEAGEPIAATGAPRAPAEQALRAALDQVAPEAQRLLETGQFTACLRTLAGLKAPVDAFFDQVMVMSEDPATRSNRLALLADLRDAMNRVAELARLAS